MNEQTFPLQVTQTTAILIETLGHALEGIYLYGSSVLGGLQPKSDLDFLVVVNRALTLESKKTLIAHLLVLSGEIDNKQGKRYLEITLVNQAELSQLTFPVYREFQYGEWLRDDYVKGYIPNVVKDEDLAILLRKVRKNSLTLYGKEAEKVIPVISDSVFKDAILASLPHVLKEIEEDETNVILTLCRMYYSIQTGEIISKDQAVDAMLPLTPDVFKPLLIKAKASYLGKNKDSLDTDVVVLHQFATFICNLIKSKK